MSQQLDTDLDAIGCYFINIFFNSLHQRSSEDYKKGEYESVTSAYKANICYYVESFNDPDSVRSTFESLLNYYNGARNRDFRFSEFEEMLVRKVFPKEYIGDLTSEQKNVIMRDTVDNLVKCLSKDILQGNDIIDCIINYRNPNHDKCKLTINYLQDKAILILRAKREKYHTDIAKQAIEGSGNPARENESLIIGLRAEILKLAEDKVRISSEADRAKSILKQVVDSYNKMKLQAASAEEHIKEAAKLRNEYNSQLQKQASLANENEALRRELIEQKKINEQLRILIEAAKNEVRSNVKQDEIKQAEPIILAGDDDDLVVPTVSFD